MRARALPAPVRSGSSCSRRFPFGINWSIYAEFVGDVFGAPLATEGFAAFMLESTFLGLWIFGWGPNSWMQSPIGFDSSNGRAG